MVEPLFYMEGLQAAVGSVVTLTGPEAKHAVSVRRMQIGEAVQLTNGLGLRVKGTVSATSSSSLELKVSEVISESKPDLEITLVQALAKGDRDELAIQAATELGVFSVIPWQAARSISRWDSVKEVKARARWQQIVNEAGKQSLRAFWPEVKPSVSTADLVKALGEFDLVLVLDVTGSQALSAVKVPKQAWIAIVVGPEGGIASDELEVLAGAGAQLVTLGANVLRTSTAGPAVIAALTLR
ncbi:MAG: 16S rRNA (uracil(1498)-N(3))-methyltransferase [Rhodoluna sp.]|nr:16S rRNA (uracil(1498)-N(3))-methyltransferase [Rhodoluna sp.]